MKMSLSLYPQNIFARAKVAFTCILLVTSFSCALRAEVAHQLQSVTVANYTGYVIDSDAANVDPLYNRHLIVVETAMEYSRSGADDFHYRYRFDIQFLDEWDVPQILVLGLGGEGTTHTAFLDVDLTSEPNPLILSSLANLRPKNRLNPYMNYRAEVRVFRQSLPGDSSYVDLDLSGQTVPNKYKHFNQLQSVDNPLNVITEAEITIFNQRYRVQTDQANDFFRVVAAMNLYRYDGFNQAVSVDEIKTRITVVMRDDLGVSIPLQQSAFTFDFMQPSYTEGGGGFRMPAFQQVYPAMELRPVNQLSSRSRTYTAEVTVSHFEEPGAFFPILGNSFKTPEVRLLDFNGTLAFAGTSGTFSSITTPVPVQGLLGSDYLETKLRINNQSGLFQSMTFGDGSELDVQLRDNGVATLVNGFLTFTGTGYPINPGNISYSVGNLVATSELFVGSINLQLPGGLGVAANSTTRIHEPNITHTFVTMDGQLKPVNSSISFLGERWAAEESKPFVFLSTGIVWDVDEDRLRFTGVGAVKFVRADAYTTLFFDELIPSSQRFKISNDGYYWQVAKIESLEVIIDTEAGTGAALMSCDLSLNATTYIGHFPNALITTNGGTQRITKDRVDTSFGGLDVASLSLFYQPNCPTGDCGNEADVENLVFHPDNGELKFTRDGGVAASGVLDAPTTLNWGWIAGVQDFAQNASSFVEAGFHASGFFMRAAEFAGNPAPQAARLLLTGVAANGADVVERPGMSAYTAGLGDYPGLNFRVKEMGDQNGRLILAGETTDPFPLTNRCKYYVRRSGVTGIHEAINGQFNPIAKIYGIDFEFTTLGWAFMDGGAVPGGSRTAGNMHVQYPSDFGLEFEKLMISCLGAPTGAEIAGSDVGAMKKLAYWNADFKPITLGFEGKDDAVCDPSDRRLVLGVEAYAGTVPQPLAGKIGFQLNGNLVTLASGDLGDFDSRFKLPSSFSMGGPGDQEYVGTPVGDAYLNDWAAAPDEPFGWMNITALVDVPFFSDMEIHLHTSARKDDEEALIYMMGGYPDHGYSVNGENFFNSTIFDVSNRGFAGNNVTQYRSGGPSGDETYRPRVQKKWLGVVNFDYPLQWRVASRSFVSLKDVTSNLVVLSSEHRIDYLSPENVEISFSASASTIPKINLANLVADAAGEVTGLLLNYLQTDVVGAGVKGLNEVLDVKQREFFEAILSPAVDATVDAVMVKVSANWNSNTKQWTGDLPAAINQAVFDENSGVIVQIGNVLKTAKDVAGVLQEIDVRLAQAENALTQIEQFIQEKDGKPLGDLEATVLGLAKIISGALDKPEFAEKIAELMKRGEPRIIEVRVAIVEVRNFITKVRTAMGEGGDLANQVIALVDSNFNSMETAAQKVRADIEQILLQVQPGVDSLANFDATLRQQMKQRIADHMVGLPVIAEFNRIIKQRLYDTTALLTEAIDEVFDQINRTLKDIIREVAGGLDDKFEEMIGDVAPIMATADIDGYAKIRNDSLTELRLDLKVSMNMPDEMKAHVYLLIRELSSDNTPAVCLPDSGKATEVTIGAKDVSVDWLFPDLAINLHAKFVMENGGYLLGLGGGIDLVGEISFGESVIVKQLGAAVMFGKFENYISAAVQLEVQGFQGGGGVYFGRACSLDPFFWDDTVAAVIGEAPFTGFYGYAEFWIPINQLIGIPSTCLFKLSAGVGAGFGAFAEGPTVFGKMFLGVSGDLLCIVSITGEISLVGVSRPSGLSLAGEGRFQAELGYCPICLKFDKTARMVSENGKWSRSVD